MGRGSCAGSSRGVRHSVRTFVEAPAANPAEDDQPHKEKGQGEEAAGDGEDKGEGGGENASQDGSVAEPKAKRARGKRGAHNHDDLPGPPLKRHQKGQYVYWIQHPYPKEEQIARGARKPSDFTHETFRALVVDAAKKCGEDIIETAVFVEPHASGKPHNNLLGRCERQWRWLKVAQYLRDEKKVWVGFGQNIKTWQEGVVYGCVASDHKPPESLDPRPVQWLASGETPLPLKQCLPAKWQGDGFIRRQKMSNVRFLDLMRDNGISEEDEAWGLAGKLADEGDRSLETYLMDTKDVQGMCKKVQKSIGAREALRRRGMTRLQLLEEAAASPCTCKERNQCYTMMKTCLEKNGVDGAFQKHVCDAMEEGRGKKACLFTQGSSNCGKSFVWYPLYEIFKTYSPPDPAGEPRYPLSSLLGAEVVFMNEFEWDKRIISWPGLKKLFEGEPVLVAVPKNGGSDTQWKGDAPIFGSCRHRIVKFEGTAAAPVVNEDESTQMDNRVTYMRFSYEFKDDKGERKNCKPCKACGAKLYLEGLEQRGSTPSDGSSSAQRGRLAPNTGANSASSGTDVSSSAQEGGSSSSTGGTRVSITEELARLAELRSQGHLDEEEFKLAKRSILNPT